LRRAAFSDHTIGYGGPHPPVGDDTHHYFFRLHALPGPSGLDAGFTVEDLASRTVKALATGRPLQPASDARCG
jgi:phosphatidylethanolamine-binding protein (PEBP) family uncharacterized protein